MNFLQNVSIKNKMIIIILSVTMLSIIIGFTVNIIREYSFLKEKIINESMMNAKLVGEYCITPLDFGYWDEAESNLSKLATIPAIFNSRIYDTKGDLFASYDKIKIKNIPPIPKKIISSTFDDQWLHIFRTIKFNGEKKGTIYLRVSTAELTKGLKSHILLMLFIGIGMMLFAYFLAIRMQRIISKPILTLANITEQISREDDYSIRIEKKSSDEIGTLYDNFNSMLDQIHIREIQRNRAKDELYHLRNYLTNIIDSMPSILVGVDAECLVTQWNRTAELFTGISAKDAEGKKLLDVLPQIELEMDKIIESIKTQKIKTELNKPSKIKDVLIYTNLTIYPLVSDNVKGAVIRIDDITKEHELEEQLNHSRRMDAIGQIAGGVAHDFNNILSGIMGAAQLLKLDDINLGDKGVEYVDMILQSVTHAADLTSKLLAFGRKGKLASTGVDVHSIIDDTIAIFTRTLDKKIEILVDKGAKNHIIVGDNTELENALINLGINSSHAMPEGGEIQINTKNIKLDKTYCETSHFDIEPGEYIEIEIRDVGCGIDPENLQKIFEPFFTTKEQGKGTGLGLAAVYGTVQDHHGAINVYSEIGTGTVFHIYLPCSEEHVEVRDIEEEILTGSGQILLVDDEEIIRITGEHMLKQMGYKVLLAENGLEAVQIFHSLHDEIDLVIMDMIMPEMNGRDAFFKIREIDKNCKIIIASGFTKYESLDELKKAGLEGFIHKPYRNSELSQLLAKVLKK